MIEEIREIDGVRMLVKTVFPKEHMPKSLKFDSYEQTVGGLRIGRFCRAVQNAAGRNLPCQHTVLVNDGKQYCELSGDQIYVHLHKQGLDHYHFDKYAEYVRKRDFPTPEDIEEAERIKQQDAEEIARIEKEKQELEAQQMASQDNTNQNKASSRLEKLKKLHSAEID